MYLYFLAFKSWKNFKEKNFKEERRLVTVVEHTFYDVKSHANIIVKFTHSSDD